MRKKLLTLGRCVDDAVADATEEWYRQHAGMRSREVAFATDLTSISASVELRPGGRVRVHVVMTALLKRSNHTHYAKYQRDGTAGYVQQEEPLL